MRTTNTNKYPNGYAEKIAYWESKIYTAKNFEQMTYASNKLCYFKEKQAELDAKKETISEDVSFNVCYTLNGVTYKEKGKFNYTIAIAK